MTIKQIERKERELTQVTQRLLKHITAVEGGDDIEKIKREVKILSGIAANALNLLKL